MTMRAKKMASDILTIIMVTTYEVSAMVMHCNGWLAGVFGKVEWMMVPLSVVSAGRSLL